MTSTSPKIPTKRPPGSKGLARLACSRPSGALRRALRMGRASRGHGDGRLRTPSAVLERPATELLAHQLSSPLTIVGMRSPRAQVVLWLAPSARRAGFATTGRSFGAGEEHHSRSVTTLAKIYVHEEYNFRVDDPYEYMVSEHHEMGYEPSGFTVTVDVNNPCRTFGLCPISRDDDSDYFVSY
jgi:hypothetical protein